MDPQNADMEQYMVLCSITKGAISAALHTNKSCGMINANTDKRYIITASESKNEYISGNLKF